MGGWVAPPLLPLLLLLLLAVPLPLPLPLLLFGLKHVYDLWGIFLMWVLPLPPDGLLAGCWLRLHA